MFTRDMDSEALMGSEVFRSLLQVEAEKKAAEVVEKVEISKEAINKMEAFQLKVNASPVLKGKFKALQERFINDSSYRESVNQDFVQGVLLLKIED
jgi:Holliday junction resolvase